MALVDTQYGKVEGLEKGGILQFRGVPFASPPVGKLRWRPPAPPKPWSGVWQADHFRPAAPQNVGISGFLPGPETIDCDEDCLYLNIFTSGTGAPLRPVMVWIHGGAFVSGSGRDAWYNGTSFARNGAVVVTINYRLGALGFLHLGEELPGSGNLGILDQVAALRWVQANIEAFGGDPNNVTIFGESAGGVNVATVMGTPSAAGLFHKAIPQSGAASHIHTAEAGAQVADRMISLMGGRNNLLEAPVERILEAQAQMVGELFRDTESGVAFMPVHDGEVLPEHP